MINPKELRIGNLVFTLSRDLQHHLVVHIPFRIGGILNSGNVVLYNTQDPDYSQDPLYFKIIHLSPIQFSPLWLERMAIPDLANYTIVQATTSPDHLLSFWLERENIRIIELKWVHQFQNLILDLTGNEVNIAT